MTPPIDHASGRSFTAALSHEIRTPAAALLAAFEVLSDEPNVSKRALKVADMAVQRLTHLTDRIEELSRLSRPDVTVQARTVELARMLEEVWEGPGLRGGFEVTISGSGDVHTDPALLAGILGELLHNAAVHGSEPVTMHAASTSTWVLIEVTDSGRGIKPENLGHIFEPFFKVAPSRVDGGGFGLGLPIAQAQAALLGGSLNVVSTPDAGTSFAVCFPRSTKL